jgi:hypothetical protein
LYKWTMLFLAASGGVPPVRPDAHRLGHLSLTLEPLAIAVGANERQGGAND